MTQACAWSRRTGVQIHLFEAFDEPHKSIQNLPLPGLTLAQSTLNRTGSYGAEGFFGLFAYTGVAAFHAKVHPDDARPPGAKLTGSLPSGLSWAEQFAGRFYPKLPDLSLAELARAFEAVTAP